MTMYQGSIVCLFINGNTEEEEEKQKIEYGAGYWPTSRAIAPSMHAFQKCTADPPANT